MVGAVKKHHDHVPNPKGLNGHTKGWQPLNVRMKYWLEKPAEEIIALFNDKPKFHKLTARDYQIVQQITDSLKGAKDLRIAERERIFNRTDPKDESVTLNVNDHTLPGAQKEFLGAMFSHFNNRLAQNADEPVNESNAKKLVTSGAQGND